MKCLNCQNWINVRVIDSRPNKNLDKTNRRYECPECETRFSTIEIYKEDYEKLLKEDISLVSEVRELKVVLDFLLRVIYRTNPLDIKEKINTCSNEMKDRIRKYTTYSLRKD